MKILRWVLIAGFGLMLLGCSSPQTPVVSAATSAPVDRPPAAKPAPSPLAEFVAMGPIVVEQELDVTSLRD